MSYKFAHRGEAAGADNVLCQIGEKALERFIQDEEVGVKWTMKRGCRLRRTAPPTSAVLEQIREGAMRSILNPETKGLSQ
jgi:hypothetical protein